MKGGRSAVGFCRAHAAFTLRYPERFYQFCWTKRLFKSVWIHLDWHDEDRAEREGAGAPTTAVQCTTVSGQCSKLLQVRTDERRLLQLNFMHGANGIEVQAGVWRGFTVTEHYTRS